MKLRHFFITLSLALSTLVWAGTNGVDHKPIHDGVLTTVKGVDYELVAKPTTLHLYARDHGKAVDLSKASAKLAWLSGAQKQEVELKPNGDKLEATGSFNLSSGTKVVAIISFAGKQAAARFVIK